MTNQEALELTPGSYVEIRYLGRNAGLVHVGIVKEVWPDGSRIDIELDCPPYGVKMGVPSKIVHLRVHPDFQAKLDKMFFG